MVTYAEPMATSDPSNDPAAERVAAEALSGIFLSDEGLADPKPFFKQLRNARPIYSSPIGVVLSRFEDCRHLLRDNRFGNGTRQPGSDLAGPEAVAYRREMLKRRADEPRSMLFLDPPDHTRQRSLVSRAFTPRRIAELRPAIATLLDESLDEVAEAGGGDLMQLVAQPFPVSVISHMLGVPSADWPRIRELVHDASMSLEPTANVEELTAAEAASIQMSSYFTELLAERRRRPTDDLISALVEAREQDDRLDDGEILAVASLLFGAGAETTTNLIGNGMNALFTHPEQMANLRTEPDLVSSAIEEMLRFDSPVQIDGRSCLEPADAFGRSFQPGDRVIALLGAANHDPEVFEDPGNFDIRRPNPSIMSFASGIHYCLGANLARVEGEEFFSALFRRFSSIEPAGERIYRRRTVLRGLAECPISVTAV